MHAYDFVNNDPVTVQIMVKRRNLSDKGIKFFDVWGFYVYRKRIKCIDVFVRAVCLGMCEKKQRLIL